jgi:hypothetical protein
MLSAPSRVRQLAGLGDTGDGEGRRGENFWGNIVAQIVGRHVRVISILTSPAADPTCMSLTSPMPWPRLGWS